MKVSETIYLCSNQAYRHEFYVFGNVKNPKCPNCGTKTTDKDVHGWRYH
jgi:tRNA(Ile2) C34 agmatinyltransferase TiaS